jgi:hypothetical protein
MSNTNLVVVTGNALHFKEVGKPEPWHRLAGTLSIAGCAFNADAIAVEWSPHAKRGHVPVAAGLREYFDRLVQASGIEFPFCEIRLTASDGNEHAYVCFIHPDEAYC